jgi:thioredoxin 1
MVKQVATVAELEKIFNEAADKAVFIDFFATWCGPCKNIAPKIEKWAAEYKNIVVLKVDVDEAEEVSQKYDISAMPTFKIFKKGQEVEEVVGADEEKVHALFKKYN